MSRALPSTRLLQCDRGGLIEELAEKYTIIIVTHSMAQAQRVSSDTAFLQGRFDWYLTQQLFENPQEDNTKAYHGGCFG